MRVDFIYRSDAAERLECEAELIFEASDGPLAGLKLVGFSLWKAPDGEKYVTVPSRAFGLGAERRFFDYLRATDGEPKVIKGFKAWILAEYEKRPRVNEPQASDPWSSRSPRAGS